MPNCAGGMTIVQLGADMCNEGRADECRQVQTACRQVQTSVDKCRQRADRKQACLHSVTH